MRASVWSLGGFLRGNTQLGRGKLRLEGSCEGQRRLFSGGGGEETVGLMFPGQGCQYVGMTKDLYSEYPAAKHFLDNINGWIKEKDLLNLMFSGPREALSQTEYAQPCIMAHSLVVIHILREHYGIDLLPRKPTTTTEETIPFLKGQKCCNRVLLGHSLGEYSALTAAGFFRLSDAAKIVHQRGKTMQQATAMGLGGMEGEEEEASFQHRLPHSMASLMPSKFEVITKIIEEMNIKNPHSCEIAAVNSPNQVVLSGTTWAVETVAAEAKRRKEARIIRQLDVSAPFHSQFMSPAASAVGRILRRINLQEPDYPLISNVTARPEKNVEDLIELLEKQTISTVRWNDMVNYASKEMGVRVWIEVGPGSVLSSLVKNIIPPSEKKKHHVFNLCSYEDIHQFSQMMSKGL